MKLKYFRVNLGNVIDPNKVYTADKPIVLDHHPVNPNDGATKGYVDAKEKEFYEDGINKLVISNVNVLPIEGPDIKHHPDMKLTVNARPDLKENLAGVLADVDDKGRIVKFHQLQAGDIDANVKVDWDDISNKPDTLEGYGIKDLVSSNKNQLVTGKTTVTLPPVHETSPIPYSHLQKIWDDSGYRMYIGDVIIKLGPVDRGLYALADGSEVSLDEFPELTGVFKPGTKDGYVKLPDCRIRDEYLLNSFGIQGRSYVRVRTYDIVDLTIEMNSSKSSKNKELKTAVVHLEISVTNHRNEPVPSLDFIVDGASKNNPNKISARVEWVNGSPGNSFDGKRYNLRLHYNEKSSGEEGYYYKEFIYVTDKLSGLRNNINLDGGKYPPPPPPPLGSLPIDDSKTKITFVGYSSSLINSLKSPDSAFSMPKRPTTYSGNLKLFRLYVEVFDTLGRSVPLDNIYIQHNGREGFGMEKGWSEIYKGSSRNSYFERRLVDGVYRHYVTIDRDDEYWYFGYAFGTGATYGITFRALDGNRITNKRPLRYFVLASTGQIGLLNDRNTGGGTSGT